MIRTLSDLLRHYGDRTLLTLKGDGNGRRTTITFEIDHPAKCLRCEGKGAALVGPQMELMGCPLCHGSGLAVEIGGSG